MDWVILAGTVGHEVPWTRGFPRPLLPIPRVSLLETLLDTFRRSPDGTCTVCANGHTDIFTGHVLGGRAGGAKVGFVEDRIPRGAAGCLKACEEQLTGDTIVVTGGSVWVDDDPAWMLEQHRSQRNTLTVFCMRGENGQRRGPETLLRPAGIYFCEPSVLGHIRAEGYQDLKEQLIPALRASGSRVGAVALANASCEVSDWGTYLRVLGEVLSAGRFDTAACQELAPGIWAGDGVEIARRARVVGPAFLGDRVRLEDDVVVVGPTILGNDSCIGGGSWLIRVVVPGQIRVPDGTSIIDQFVPPERRTGAVLNTLGPGGAGWCRP